MSLVAKEAPVGAWRSLVAHLFWVQGVGGSNPLAPTTSFMKTSDSGTDGRFALCGAPVSVVLTLGEQNVACIEVRQQKVFDKQHVAAAEINAHTA